MALLLWRTEPGLCPTLPFFLAPDKTLALRRFPSSLSEVFFYEFIKVIQAVLGTQIPIRGSGYCAMTTFFTVREQFFMEKTGAFLKGFEDINEDFRTKLDKAISDQRHKEELEERLIIALDRFDELAKAEALFKIFIAYIDNEITQHDFLHYLYILDKINIQNLEIFRAFYESEEEVTSDCSMNSFAFVGLLRLITRFDITVFGKNESGSKFLKILDRLT